MRKLILAALLLYPTTAFAEHLDVIELKLKEGCSLEKYLEIAKDFNEWGKTVGYHARVAVPIQSNNLVHAFWLGTTKDAAAYGKAWDTWRDALSDPDSEPAKLWARFQDCSVNLGRRGYDVY